MTIDGVVAWYNKNVNYKLTKAFLKNLIKIGIVKEDIDLELLNLFLLESSDNNLVKQNGKYSIKKNRIPVIDKFKDNETPKKQEKKETKLSNGARNMFKIEKISGKRLKLVKIK
jgi:hypothetical protein